MDSKTALQMLRNIRDVAFATVNEQGQPEVRIIDVMLVEDCRLYFCTARGKNFYQQLKKSGYVAITGLNKDWKSVRLMGKVQTLDNQKSWIDQIFEENPSMNQVYPGDSRYILEAFCISDAEIEVFDLGKSPIERHSFHIGDAVEHEKVFFITDSCIGCGTCQSNCPQQCIDDGIPFVINSEHCLHCGLCFENCPVQAIERK